MVSILRDALTPPPGEEPAALRLVSGVVTARQVTTAPYTVTVQLADGTTVGGLTYAGWWDPRVNDVVQMIRQGPLLYVLGPVAPALTVTSPHRHKAGDVDGTTIPTPPNPTAPTQPPAPPATTRTVPVGPVWAGSYWPTMSKWYQNDIRQGGPNYTGLWFYGGGIAAAKGGGTIIGGTIYMRRSNTSHGVNGPANVRLGAHNGAGPGQTFTVQAVSVPAQLGKGQDAAVPLPQPVLDLLNAGWTGLALAPGSGSYSSPDYLRVDSGGASGALSLTVRG